MYKERLFGKELLVLNTLCSKGEPMTSLDIVCANPGLSQSTVQTTLRKLLEKKLVMVCGTVHSSNVMARTFVVTDAAREEVLLHFVESYGQIKRIVPVQKAIIALVGAETDKIKQKELLSFLHGIIDAQTTE